MLARAVGPVLDIGCGVGRHVVALRGRGVRAVGVEISPVAVAIARERGAEVIEASAFEHPTTSDWRTILLLDGNIGIGGDAVRLLRRCNALLAPGGGVLVELEPPADRAARPAGPARGRPRRQRLDPLALRRLRGDRPARRARPGFGVAERWQADGRWFAHLRTRCVRRNPRIARISANAPR